MFGQKITVEIFEYDKTGSPALLKRYDNLFIKDNVLYLPVEMSEIYRKAKSVRAIELEGDNFDIFAKVIPFDRSIAAKNSDMIYLGIEKSIYKIAKSTIEGTQKFRIGKVEDSEKEKNCRGKYCITKSNYKEKKAEKLVQELLKIRFMTMLSRIVWVNFI